MILTRTHRFRFYTEKICIQIYVIFYNDNSEKYYKSRESGGVIVLFFLTNWKFFAVKILKIRKLYETLVYIIIQSIVNYHIVHLKFSISLRKILTMTRFSLN